MSFLSPVLFQPAISVGNVGQLACDLLIATLDVEKVGYFCSPCFLPIVGNNPFASSLQAENSNTPCLSSEGRSCYLVLIGIHITKLVSCICKCYDRLKIVSTCLIPSLENCSIYSLNFSLV